MAGITWAARMVPTRRPSSSATTPRPLGDDRAASSRARSDPWSRATVPPRCSTERSPRDSTASARTQPSGSPVVTDAQHPAVTDRADLARQLAPSRDRGLVGERELRRRARRRARGSRGRGRRSRRRSRRPGRRAAWPGESSWASTPPDPQHGHLVAELDGLVDVVGDEEDRLAELGLQAEELVLELLADDGVDGARTARP